MARTVLLLLALSASAPVFAAQGKSPDDYPKGAESPEALFEKISEAAAEENWARFLSAVHPDDRLYFVGWLYGGAGMLANVRSEFLPAFQEIQREHNCRPLRREDARLLRGVPTSNKPQFAALVRRADDPVALLGDVVTFMRDKLGEPRIDVASQSMIGRKDKPNGQVVIQASYATPNGGEGRVDWYVEAEFTRWHLLYYR